MGLILNYKFGLDIKYNVNQSIAMSPFLSSFRDRSVAVPSPSHYPEVTKIERYLSVTWRSHDLPFLE